MPEPSFLDLMERLFQCGVDRAAFVPKWPESRKMKKIYVNEWLWNLAGEDIAARADGHEIVVVPDYVRTDLLNADGDKYEFG